MSGGGRPRGGAGRSASRAGGGARRPPQPRRRGARPPVARPAARRPERARAILASTPHAELLLGEARRPFLAAALFLAPALVALAGVGLLAAGLLLAGALCVVVGLVVVALDVLVASPRRLLARMAARPADVARDARLLNVVEGLCVAIGVAAPELRVLEDGALNAVVIGSRRRAVLCCTEGLLERLDRMELEAVVAHELAHLKRGDAAAGAFAALACGALLPWLPAAGRLVARLSGDDREALADLAGVRCTRYPPALAAALEVAAASSVRPAALDPLVARAAAGWWFAPLAEAEPATAVAGRLDLALRAAAMHEL